MSFTRQVYLEVDGEKDLSLVMTYRFGAAAPDSFEIEVFRGKEAVGKGAWDVDAEHYAFIFDPVSSPGHAAAACVAKCLGIAVGKGLIECLWAAQGDLPKIRACIKDKAVGVLLDAAHCVASCV